MRVICKAIEDDVLRVNDYFCFDVNPRYVFQLLFTFPVDSDGFQTTRERWMVADARDSGQRQVLLDPGARAEDWFAQQLTLSNLGSRIDGVRNGWQEMKQRADDQRRSWLDSVFPASGRNPFDLDR